MFHFFLGVPFIKMEHLWRGYTNLCFASSKAMATRGGKGLG